MHDQLETEAELLDRLWDESAPKGRPQRLFDVRLFEVCVICGSDESIEQHHWAPSAIFPEADWWVQTVPLCPDHHHEWHDRMREHGLRWPHELVTR